MSPSEAVVCGGLDWFSNPRVRVRVRAQTCLSNGIEMRGAEHDMT